MSETNRELARAYIEAIGGRDFDRLRGLLHPDMEFGGAAASIHGADAFVTAMRRLTLILARNEIREIVVEGDRAFVLYDFVTDTDAGAVLSGELLGFEDGRIRSTTLLFDMRRWPEVVAELGRRVERLASASPD